MSNIPICISQKRRGSCQGMVGLGLLNRKFLMPVSHEGRMRNVPIAEVTDPTAALVRYEIVMNVGLRHDRKYLRQFFVSQQPRVDPDR